jgi:hypothetical protein
VHAHDPWLLSSVPELRRLAYQRYDIAVAECDEVVPLPPRFRVRVSKPRLAAHVARAVIESRGDLGVALSRPCVYGTFSRPVGGMAPIEDKCVGCLRCMVEYPGMVRVERNPARAGFGGMLGPDETETILYEARTGGVPVRGAGFRGAFGGSGWEGIWLDMSEIVRPTRDGIHGREYISTTVDLGSAPTFLQLDADGRPTGPLPRFFPLDVPFLFDAGPVAGYSPLVAGALLAAARRIGSLAIVPAAHLPADTTDVRGVLPRVGPSELELLDRLPPRIPIVELDGWDGPAHRQLRRRDPDSLVAVRVPADADTVDLVRQGVEIVHLDGGPDGWVGGSFVDELIRRAHLGLVEAGMRERVTLLGSGGVVAAEHVPKAISCGLDAVVLDQPLWAALQGRPASRPTGRGPVAFPAFRPEWGTQRLVNLAGAWRSQLLEVMGAMGMREVRRLRGELGRCMFQADLEREAFAGMGIDGDRA